MRIALALLFALPALAPARAIVAPGVHEAQVRAVLAGAENDVRACIQEARPERATRVRVQLDWRPQRRTGLASMHISAPVARDCIQSKLETALRWARHQRATPATLTVAHVYRIDARTTVAPTTAFDPDTVTQTMRQLRGRLLACARSPGVPGEATLRIQVRSDGRLHLLGASGVETRVASCMGRVVRSARLAGAPPAHATVVEFPILLGPAERARESVATD